MRASATWVDGRMFVGEAGSGHSVVMDGAAESGGRNAGIRPMEMLLLGLAGCTAFDVVHILERGRHHVTGCRVDADAVRAEHDPKVFTEIVLRYRIEGSGLSREPVARAVQLSAEKYCSASIMLGATARIRHDIEIVPSPD